MFHFTRHAVDFPRSLTQRQSCPLEQCPDGHRDRTYGQLLQCLADSLPTRRPVRPAILCIISFRFMLSSGCTYVSYVHLNRLHDTISTWFTEQNAPVVQVLRMPRTVTCTLKPVLLDRPWRRCVHWRQLRSRWGSRQCCFLRGAKSHCRPCSRR